jgi:hypothetical protein
VPNPDYAIRTGDVQYMVYDAFSSTRSSFFRDRFYQLVDKYEGQIVHIEYMPGYEDENGQPIPIMIVYLVYP